MALGFSERDETFCCRQPRAEAPPALPVGGALLGQNKPLISLSSSLPIDFPSVQKEGFDLGISPPLIPKLNNSSWGFPSDPKLQQHSRAPVRNSSIQLQKKNQKTKASVFVYCKQGHWQHTACSRACIGSITLLKWFFSIKMAVENGVHVSTAIRQRI